MSMIRSAIAWDGKTLSSIGPTPLLFVPDDNRDWKAFGERIVAIGILQDTELTHVQLKEILNLFKQNVLKNHSIQETFYFNQYLRLLAIDSSGRPWVWGLLPDERNKYGVLSEPYAVGMTAIGDENDYIKVLLDARVSSRQAVGKAAERFDLLKHELDIQTLNFTEQGKVEIKIGRVQLNRK